MNNYAMNNYIESVEVLGLHGQFDMHMEFSEGVNIVYGVNGAGKTTMLHVLANVANFDLERFAELAFHSVRMKIASGPEIFISAASNHDLDNSEQITLRVDGVKVVALPHRGTGSAREDERESIREMQKFQVWKRELRIPLEVTYFPAFRTMSEAWSSVDFSELWQNRFQPRQPWPTAVQRQMFPHRESEISERWQDNEVQTTLARGIFGPFVPRIRYPSPREIQRDLDGEIRRAQSRLEGGDQFLLSETFQRVFSAISRRDSDDRDETRAPDEIRDSIRKQLDQLQSLQSEYGLPDIGSDFDALRSGLGSPSDLTGSDDVTTTRVLSVYEYVLAERKKNLQEAFDTVRAYITAVNHFFNKKQLVTASTDENDTAPQLHIKHEDGTLSELDTLSSGERQVAGLIYSASQVAQGNVVLVDEPELSLHIDWQRVIIKAMVEQLPLKQLIVCTHSPVVGAEYRDKMKELVARPTRFKSTQILRENWGAFDDPEDIV